MVSIRIIDALEDMGVDLLNKGDLVIRKNVLNGLDGEEVKHQIRKRRHWGSTIYLLDHVACCTWRESRRMCPSMVFASAVSATAFLSRKKSGNDLIFSRSLMAGSSFCRMKRDPC